MRRREICSNIGHGDVKKACTLWHNLTFPNSRNNYVLFIKKKERKEKKERETKKELIGSLGYIKCIPSLLVELSSCYLAFSGMGQDKIPPPHQVRRSFDASPGLPTWPSLKLEQSSNCQTLCMTAGQTGR